MAHSSSFLRGVLALIMISALSLACSLFTPPAVVSASNLPLSSHSPAALNLTINWPSYINPAQANPPIDLLVPCATRPGPVAVTQTVPPPAQPVTAENNPDSWASAPGDALPGLQTALDGLVQSSVAEGLDAASVVIKDSLTGQVLQVNPDQVYQSASLYKIFVLWKVQEEINAGQLSDDSLIPYLVYSDEEKNPGEPDNTPTTPTAEGTISVGDARQKMITLSDNAAAWSLAWAVGWYNIDAMLQQHGYTVTKTNVTDEPKTNAAEVTRFFEELYHRTLDTALSDADYDLMLGLFKEQRLNSKLPTGLPDDAVLAHKTGELDNLSHDAGILLLPDGRAVFITVMTQGYYDASHDLMTKVAAFAWQNLGHKPLPVYFPATQKTVSGHFYQYWQAEGGLASFGYPLNEAQLEFNQASGKYFLTQWFERARFEYHPENAGTPYEVQLGLLGSEMCKFALQVDPRFLPAKALNEPGRVVFFPETRHNLGNAFLAYWQQTGGLARYGLPISEEHPEINTATGQQYTVQWFERARFEYHPENAGTPYTVLLGLLGREYSGLTGG